MLTFYKLTIKIVIVYVTLVPLCFKLKWKKGLIKKNQVTYLASSLFSSSSSFIGVF